MITEKMNCKAKYTMLLFLAIALWVNAGKAQPLSMNDAVEKAVSNYGNIKAKKTMSLLPTKELKRQSGTIYPISIYQRSKVTAL
ncbi:MAG: hypothetical protein UZ12_BCD005002088 [Bacteroidetes bacterium OLB12]|nr:MAG: hypothetical protein UZ12_BCD005002088 [Bacteroidetes bacterium OLB12]